MAGIALIFLTMKNKDEVLTEKKKFILKKKEEKNTNTASDGLLNCEVIKCCEH